MLQPVQRRPDQRGDDGERCDGDQQVQRDLALAFAGGRREEQRVGQRDSHRGVDCEVRHHRPRQRGQPGLVGAVGRGGAVHQAVHLGAHLAAALRGRPRHGDPLASRGADGVRRRSRSVRPRRLVERRQPPVGARCRIRPARPAVAPVDGVTGVVGHPGMFVVGVGGRTRWVVASLTPTRGVPVVTARSGHIKDSPPSGRRHACSRPVWLLVAHWGNIDVDGQRDGICRARRGDPLRGPRGQA